MMKPIVRNQGACCALLVGMLLTFVLGGCGSAEPLRVSLSVTGAPDMNSGGNAAVVRIYQLSSRSNFQQAPLETFWRDDEAALGNELVAPRVQVMLYPNGEEQAEIEIHEATRFIGVAVDSREPEEDYWRDLFTVEEVEEEQPFILQVGERRLMLATVSS